MEVLETFVINMASLLEDTEVHIKKRKNKKQSSQKERDVVVEILMETK